MAAKKFRDWVRQHQITVLSPTRGVPSLVDEIAGPGLKGSWWSHPKGAAIYNTSRALMEDPAALTLKLVAGKVTFVYSDSLPLLFRVTFDPEWRKRKIALIDKETRWLLKLVDEAGVVCLDTLAHEWKGGLLALKKSRKLLENHALAVGGDVHTDTGRHATTLESWAHIRQRTGREPDSRVTLQQAIERLKHLTAENRLTVELR